MKGMDLCDRKCEYTPADGESFLTWNAGRSFRRFCFPPVEQDASKRLVVWCERQEEKGGQIEYSDEEAEVQEAGDDSCFLRWGVCRKRNP